MSLGGMIRLSYLSSLRSYLLNRLEAGSDAVRALKSCGEAVIPGTGEMDCWKAAETFDALAAWAPDNFAFEFGLGLEPHELGLVGASLISSPTLGASAELWSRYSELTGHPLKSTVTVSPSEWDVSYRPAIPLTPRAMRFAAESVLGSMSALGQNLIGRSPVFFRVRLPWVYGMRTERYEKLGQGNLVSADHLAFVGPRQEWETPLESADHRLARVLTEECEIALNASRERMPLWERIHTLFSTSPGEIGNLESTASNLAMSRRSLQRRLEAENMTYQSVVRDYRIRFLKLLSNDEQMTAKQTSFLLGFSDPNSFYRFSRELNDQLSFAHPQM